MIYPIFGTILRQKPTAYTFKVYKKGPFTAEIYADIERLVVLNYTHAEEMEKWKPEQDRSFKYEITNPGIRKIDAITDMGEFSFKEEAIDLALQAAGHLSGTNTMKLVYSEPNYIKAKNLGGFNSIIDPEYGFARKFREMARRIAVEQYRLELGGNEISWLYLNFMKMIQSQSRNVVETRC